MQKKTLLAVLSCLLSWWLMQMVHELGHVFGAITTGGYVERVVLNPFSLSRVDVSPNPHPAIVVWAGPMFGVAFPFLVWIIAKLLKFKAIFFLFFAGFCFIANGLYIGIGSFEGIGDAGEMTKHGSPIWSLWIFGVLSSLMGFWLWNRLGPGFGLRAMETRSVNVGLMWTGAACFAYGTLASVLA